MKRNPLNLERYSETMRLKEEGLSIYKIAQKLGISDSTVRHWIVDGTRPFEVWGNEFNELIKSKILRGEKHPMYGKRGSLSPIYGSKHTEEAKRKISTANKGENNGMWKGDNASKGAGRQRARRMFKDTSKGKDIHHKNGNPLDNSPENIQIATRREHMEADGRINDRCPHCHCFTGNFTFCNNCGEPISTEAKRIREMRIKAAETSEKLLSKAECIDGGKWKRAKNSNIGKSAKRRLRGNRAEKSVRRLS